MWIYQAPPIDWLWDSLPDIDDAVEAVRCASSGAPNEGDMGLHERRYWAAEAGSLRSLSQSLLEIVANERVVEGPKAIFLPNPDDGTFDAAVAVKVWNNGTTYIMSPLPLAWLSDWELASA